MNDEPTETTLKLCPFCGRKAAERDIKVPGGNGWIGCQSCRCFIDFVKNGKPQATAAWNRRAEDERFKNALKEIVQLACESVEREKALARLEAEVMVWAKAEQEGRLVALPCKVGDTVYEALLEWDCTECLKTSFKPKVRERKVTHFMFGKSGDIIVGVAGDGADYLIYGKTVFLTREEAEEALKEAQHE